MSSLEDLTPTTTPKQRQPSCDLCRKRKVKCVKPPFATQCEGCSALGQECEYKYSRRKPGPTSRYSKDCPIITPEGGPQLGEGSIRSDQSHVLRRRRVSRSPLRSMSSGASNLSQQSLAPFSPRHETVPRAQSHLSPQHTAPWDVFPFLASPPPLPASDTAAAPVDALPSTEPSEVSLAQPGVQRHDVESAIDWSWLYMSPKALFNPLIVESSTISFPSPSNCDGTIPPNVDRESVPRDGTHTSGRAADMGYLTTADRAEQQSGGLSSPSAPLFGNSHAPAPHVGIEEWIPWRTLTRILHAYHTHLYPLLPVLHWPTFLQRLMSREDERSRSWRAFLLSLVAYSIIQLPRSALSFVEMSALRHLHRRCHAGSVALQNRSYKTVTINDIACDHIYLSTLGRTTAANVALSKAIRLAQELRIHDEGSSEVSVDRIELEVRRRVFWLLYGSDRTISALTFAPLQINDADLSIPLPTTIDDNLITASGAFPQPPGACSVLSGFHHVSRIFHLLGSILTAHRSLSALDRSVQSDLSLLPPLAATPRPASDFQTALQQILADLPYPLQLNSSMNSQPLGQMDNTSDRPPQHSSDIFETCRANLLVSQALVRYAIQRYAVAVGDREDEADDKIWVEKHVLSMLEMIPTESLAANGESLRSKVLYVASKLIEKYHGATEGGTYIASLLALYARIRENQQANALESSESVLPSRAPSPDRV
ncbi:uncharacterized protein L199_007854 [Kwoniella botswanensis]|uniref:uncharacterized protein n=1 Tax=Kwoniella botswanensis TaxID=1268659 RepID=UPI00315C74AE